MYAKFRPEGAGNAALDPCGAAGHSDGTPWRQPGGVMGYPDGSMARGGGVPGPALDPLEMLQSAADLVNPVAGMRQMPWLASELVKIPLARSDTLFGEGDRRFAD